MDTVTYENIDARSNPTLFALFSSVRSDELGMQGWDRQLRESILRIQFEARRRGYCEQFPAAEWRLIVRNGKSVGWVVVDRSGDALHGVDIAIVNEERSQGIGRIVIQTLKDEAAAGGRPFVISVQRANVRAAALYIRLGFRVMSEDDVHTLMEWRYNGNE